MWDFRMWPLDEVTRVETLTRFSSKKMCERFTGWDKKAAITGVSMKAGYRRSTAACRTSYRHWISLMKIKMILIKKQIRRRRPLKFPNATKTAPFLMPRTLEIAFSSF